MKAKDGLGETIQLQVALSARELEVLELIARGCKNSEIALALDIQERKGQ